MLELTKTLPKEKNWPAGQVELEFRLLKDSQIAVYAWYGAARLEARAADLDDYTRVVIPGRITKEYALGINYASLKETLAEGCSEYIPGVIVSLDGYSCRIMYRDVDNRLMYKTDACCCARVENV